MKSLIHSRDELPESEYRLFVPVLEGVESDDLELLLDMGEALVADRDGTMLLGCLATFPRQTPLDTMTAEDEAVAEAQSRLEDLLAFASLTDVTVSGIVGLTHREWRSILDLVEKYDCDGVLMTIDPARTKQRRLLTGSTVEKVVSRAECDVFVEKQRPVDAPIRSILLAVSGGPHSGLAADTARVIARTTGARVDAVHFLDEDASPSDREAGERIVRAAERVLADVNAVDAELLVASDAAKAIVTRSDDFDLTVIGAPTSGLLRQLTFGSVVDTVEQRSQNAVLMTKRNVGFQSAYDRWIAGDPSDPDDPFDSTDRSS